HGSRSRRSRRRNDPPGGRCDFAYAGVSDRSTSGRSSSDQLGSIPSTLIRDAKVVGFIPSSWAARFLAGVFSKRWRCRSSIVAPHVHDHTVALAVPGFVLLHQYRAPGRRCCKARRWLRRLTAKAHWKLATPAASTYPPSTRPTCRPEGSSG